MLVFFTGAGIICTLYYVVIILDSGITSAFSWFWLLAGCFFNVVAAVKKHMNSRHYRLPRAVLWIIGIILAAGLTVFAAVEFQLIRTVAAKAGPDADYLIVLGAQVRGETPSRILRSRVETAADYLRENPRTKVIASGGQGSGEDISEAQCMKNLLTELGIEPERIFMEDKSTDTYENIRNSLEICGTDQKIVIVTCGYHMYRAQQLARAAGAVHVEGTASPEDKVLTVNYYVREFFAVIKYKLWGQI